MNTRGSYAAVAGVLMIALLGLAMVSLQVERNARPEWNLALDARPVWVNAWSLVREGACGSSGGKGNTTEALALLAKETGYHCEMQPSLRSVESVARFDLVCEKRGENMRTEYRRSVRVLAEGC